MPGAANCRYAIGLQERFERARPKQPFVASDSSAKLPVSTGDRYV